MAWMLSIKYFVFFAEILRFSLNWRTYLQNGVISSIYFTSVQCLHGLYYIRLCFYKFLVYGLNVIDQVLCFINSNFKIFPKIDGHISKIAYSLVFILRQVNAPNVCITSVCVFFQFFVYGLNVIDQILCLFCLNFKNFPKLTDTSTKWSHFWNFIFIRSMPLRFVLHSVCVFISSWCMAWMLSI